MSHRRSILVSILLLGWMLAACSCRGKELVATTTSTASPLPFPTRTPVQPVLPTLTGIPSLTYTSIPTMPPTPTAAPIPCEPSAGYCLETGHFFLDRPIALPGTDKVDPTYTYGNTQNGARQPHHGVEFYNASGTPVLAAADGRVVVAGDDHQVDYGLELNFYGKLIVLEHRFPGIDQPVYTLYGHLSEVDVQVEHSVLRGSRIGAVGATGEAIGSHLHFEVRLGKDDYDSNRNPVLWLRPLNGDDGHPFGMIAGRLTDVGGNPIYTRSLNIQYFPDPAGPQAAAYPVETYAVEGHPVGSDDLWNENFTLSDLPAGHYRISLVWNGSLYDRWIEVLPGKVTFIVFQIGQ